MKHVMPSAIDQRLASLLHQARIRALSRVDRLTRQVGDAYSRMGRELLRAAAVPEPESVVRIDEIVDSAFAGAHKLIRDGFRSEVEASNRAAVRSMIRAIPYRWFRALHPMVVEAEEPSHDHLSDEEKRALIEELVFPPPTPERVDELLDHTGAGGVGWEERLSHWEAPVREQIRKQLVVGIADVEAIGITALRRSLEPIVGGVRYKAQRIARTEGRRMAELGQMEAYAQAAELIDAMQIIATLDTHTRAHHAARHGKTFAQQPNGSYLSTDGEFLPDLPDEPNCRCYASPILKMPVEIENDPTVRTQFENASRELIADPSSYNQWWATATEKEKRRSVGGRRYSVVAKRLASQGRQPEWEDFLDPTGKLMPMDRLKRQTWQAWANRRERVRAMIDHREQIMRQVAATGFDWPVWQIADNQD